MLNMKKEKEALKAKLEENDIAEKLNEAIKKSEAAQKEEEEKDLPDGLIFIGELPDELTFIEELPDELSSAEKLSLSIAEHLSFVVAERFWPIAEEIGPEAAKKLVVRIESSEPETAVKMLQSMFLANGMVHAAEELDMLSYCAKHDSDVYSSFIDYLFETDIFDWYSIESLFDEYWNNSPETQGD